MSDSSWPANWPKHYNGSVLCDALVGFCSCGALHKPGEFAYAGGILYRYDKPVAQKKKTLEELKQQRDLLDSKIKRLRIEKNIDEAAIFLVRLITPSGEKQELYFNDPKEVAKIKQFFIKLLNKNSLRKAKK